MRPALTNRDPGDEQPALFDPATTVAPVCLACNTSRKNLCRHDADIHYQRIPASSTRPRTCLNTAQNRDGVPY